MVWPQTRPYKMVFLVNYLGSFLSTTILIFSSKNGQTFAFMLQKKTPGPFCRASTLPGTQLQGQFFHSHFVGFLSCHSFFFNFTQNWLKNVSQFLHVAKPYIFFQQYADILETNWNQNETQIPLQNGECVGKMGSLQNGQLIFPRQWLIHNIYKNQNVPWKLSTKWLFVPYRTVRFGAKKLWCLQQKVAKAVSNPLFTTESHPPTPFFHRMEAYRRVDSSHSVQEMARGMYIYIHICTYYVIYI